MSIARDGLREILISTAIFGPLGTVACWAAMAVSPWYGAAAVPLLALWLLTFAFFRDPDRPIPTGEGLLVAPADGRVTDITRLDRHDSIEGPAVRIGIFLSVFDVHINRSPCSGRVVRTEYRPGSFLDARHPDSGTRNEANTVVIEPEPPLPGPLVVRQIAGLVARRIVCSIRIGDSPRRGQRIGLIKFGSRTELIVPANGGLEPVVRVNDHVKGGSTILMRLSATPEHPVSPVAVKAATSQRPLATVACDSQRADP